MFGFPKRAQQRRPQPVVPRFDPSGDATCSGWWRADRGLSLSDSLVQSWANQIAPYQPFTKGSGLAMIYAPKFTNGWPALLFPYGMATYVAGQILQTGDTAFTLTYVMRSPSPSNYNGNTHISVMDASDYVQLGIYDNYLRFLVTSGAWSGWTNWFNGQFYPNGTTAIAVVAMRMQYDGTNRTYALSYNGQHRSSAAATSNGPVSNTAVLRIHPELIRPIYMHEIIVHRRYLADAEVSATHAALAQQYTGA